MRIRDVALFAALVLFSLFQVRQARADDWIVTAGARIRIKPPYEGSDTHIVSVIPSVVARRADQPYRYNPPDGATAIALLDTQFIVAGPVLRVRDSRPDDGRFAGLTRVASAWEPGVFVNLWPTSWLRAHMEVRKGVAGHEGWVEDGGLDLIRTAKVDQGERWDAAIGPRIGYGDARYMMTYFGVTPAEAAVRIPPTPAYTPGAGARYAGLAAAAAYHLSKRWRVNADVSYERLGSKALSSPIIETVGSGDQIAFGFGFSYTFGVRL